MEKLSNDSSQCDADGAFEVYDALYAAGIAVVFSAGNDGPDEATITPPKFNNWDLVRLFAVESGNRRLDQRRADQLFWVLRIGWH